MSKKIKRRKIKYLFTLFVIILFVLADSVYIYKNAHRKIVEPIRMDVTIPNESGGYMASNFGSEYPYPVDFLQINAVSFASDKTNLYVKFVLEANLPKTDDLLPYFDGDRLIGAVYYIDLDSNYFDSTGAKNPSSYDANLKFSFYGAQDSGEEDNGKVEVQGKLIEGGPGYKYFVVSFPYSNVLFNQSGSKVVFNARAVALSKTFPAGASTFQFENKTYGVDVNDSSDILINLSKKN